MTIPFLDFTDRCCRTLPEPTPRGSSKKNLTDHIAILGSAFDAFVSITALAIGILGLYSFISMPSLVAYSLVSLSGVITLLWAAMFIKGIICWSRNSNASQTEG